MGNFVKDSNRIWPNSVIPYAWGSGFNSSAVAISAWVGLKGNASGSGNDPADVWQIQRALNDIPAAQGGPNVPLVLDGIVGPKTQGAIQKFQLKWFGWPGADSRVDPQGQTLAKINEMNQGVPDHDQVIVDEAVAEWNRVLQGSVQWRPRVAGDKNYVIFEKTLDFNRSDTLGRDPTSNTQKLYVNMGKIAALKPLVRVTPTGILLHEMGHVAGLGHEHQRSDRDQHVTIDKKNARYCDYRMREPDTTFATRINCPKPFIECQTWGHYDHKSTMHYFAHQGKIRASTQPVMTAIANGQKVKPQPMMGGLMGLMASDIATLRHFYPQAKL